MTEIDTIDYALLSCIAAADGPVWKKQLHNQLQEHDPPLPGNTQVSLQTVGRHINTMHDQGLVDTAIIQPPDVSQNLIIGYVLTDEGWDALNEKRRDIIGSYAFRAGQDQTASTDRDTLIQLLHDDLQFNTEEQEVIHEQDVEALLVFTLLYHTSRLVDSMLDRQTEEAFLTLITRRREREPACENIAYSSS